MTRAQPRSGAGARPLVERESELALLRRAVTDLGRGTGSVVLIEGEAGIGKSSLLEAARAEGQRAGHDVRRAQAHGLEHGFAFGLVLQLLAGRLEEARGADRDDLLRGAAGAAAPLLEGRLVTGHGTDVFPLLHALTWFVTNAAAQRSLVLCVDDAHAADLPSLRFVNYLAQRTPELPLVLLVAARTGTVGPLGEQLTGLRSRAGRRLRPAPLSRDGVGWLMAGMGYAGADAVFVEACAEVTSGNPFLLRELLLVLADRDTPGTAEAASAVRAIGPRAVAEAVAMALAPSGPTGVALVRALAVLDGDVTVELVAEVASIDRLDAVRVARELADAGVLATGNRIAFAHPVVQTAIAGELPAFERAFLHQRAADALHARQAPTEQVVAHLLDADPGSAPWAVDVLRDGARRALAGGTPAVAVRLLRRARQEPGYGDDPELLAELAGAQAAAGDPDAATTVTEALARVEDPLRQAGLLLQLGRAHLLAGRYGDATEAFARGRAACPPDAEVLAADLRSGWASAAMWLPDGGGDVLSTARSTILTVVEPRSGGERVALAQYAGGLLLRGRDRDTAIDLARRAWGDGEMLTTLGPQDAAAYTASAVLADGDAIPEGLAVAEAIERDARARGMLLPAATATYVRGSYLMMLGRLTEATAAIDEALAAEAHGWGTYASGAHWIAARVALLRGDRERAVAAITVSPEREAALSEGLDYAAMPLARGLVALERGDAATATDLLEDAARRIAPLGVCIGRYNWRPPLIRARLAHGDAAGARALADENLALAREWGAALAVGAGLRALAATDPGQGVTLLREAQAVLVASGERIERTLVDLELGQALAAAGEREPALAALRSALDQADACGADGVAATARGALVALGARPRRARTTGVAALTPAELRVAGLARDGLSNREIAEHLFVTIKAVKWHLGNAYRKLGISSRAQLADALQARASFADRF